METAEILIYEVVKIAIKV